MRSCWLLQMRATECRNGLYWTLTHVPRRALSQELSLFFFSCVKAGSRKILCAPFSSLIAPQILQEKATENRKFDSNLYFSSYSSASTQTLSSFSIVKLRHCQGTLSDQVLSTVSVIRTLITKGLQPTHEEAEEEAQVGDEQRQRRLTPVQNARQPIWVSQWRIQAATAWAEEQAKHTATRAALLLSKCIKQSCVVDQAVSSSFVKTKQLQRSQGQG